jgi:hypothetical protein
MKTPEHDKLHKVKDRSQVCGEFIEWLAGRGIHLASAHEHTRDCRREDGWRGCGMLGDGGALYTIATPLHKLLAEFFGINLAKLEHEKTATLARLRSLAEKSKSKHRQRREGRPGR